MPRRQARAWLNRRTLTPNQPEGGAQAVCCALLARRCSPRRTLSLQRLVSNQAGKDRARWREPSTRTSPWRTRCLKSMRPTDQRCNCPVSASTVRSTSYPGSVVHTVIARRWMTNHPSVPPGPDRTKCTTVRSTGSFAGIASWWPPQQSLSVALLRGRVTEHPLGSPVPEGPHDGGQRLAGCGERIATGPTARRRFPDHQPTPFEQPQPLGEQGAAHSRDPSMDLVEAIGTDHQLPDDQRGPSVTKDVDIHGDRTVLVTVPSMLFPEPVLPTPPPTTTSTTRGDASRNPAPAGAPSRWRPDCRMLNSWLVF